MNEKFFDTFCDESASQEAPAVLKTAACQKKRSSKALRWAMCRLRKAAAGLQEDQIRGIAVALNRALRKGEVQPGEGLRRFTEKGCAQLEGRYRGIVRHGGMAWRHVYIPAQLEEPADLDRRGCYSWGRSFVVGVLNELAGYGFAMPTYGVPPAAMRVRRIQRGMDSLYRVLDWLNARWDAARATARLNGWDDWLEEFKQENWAKTDRVCAEIEKLRAAREALEGTDVSPVCGTSVFRIREEVT